MDVISLGKASQALNKTKDLDINVVAPKAEGRFPTVDARLDWLEAQAGKIKATSSKQLDLTIGTFTNTEVAGGKIQLKAFGTNAYATSGTWESPIIDLGEGWINTSLVDVVKQIATPTTDISLEVASSQDGMSFTNYESLDPTTPPQARYVKIRASLSAQAGPGEATNLDFNNQDPQNTFTLDDKLVADGQLKFKTRYTSAMTNEGAVGTGTVLSAVIDKTQFKSIKKVSDI
jgi:hypothetical protein